MRERDEPNPKHKEAMKDQSIVGVDYDPMGEQCPHCGGCDTRRQDCGECEDGYINRYDEDPLWYDIDDQSICENCDGHSGFAWCRDCGYDFITKKGGDPKKKLHP